MGARAEVVMQFDAQTATFVQAVMQARTAMEAGASTARNFGTEVAKAGEKAEGAFAKMGESAVEMVKNYAGITGAAALAERGIEAFAQAFEAYFERMVKRAETLLGAVQGLNSALAVSGQIEAAPAVRAQLSGITSIAGEVVNPNQRNAAFNAISRAVGNKVSNADKIDATKLALTGHALQMDDAGATELGVNYAQLTRERRPGGAFAGYSNDQLADLAKQVTENIPGGLSDKQLRFFGRAKNKPEALQMLFAAAQSDEASKGLMAIQSAAEEVPSDTEAAKLRHEQLHRKTRSDENARKLLIYEKSKGGADIAHEMFNNEALAPAADRTAIRRLREGMTRIPVSRGVKEELEHFEANMDESTRLSIQSEEIESVKAAYEMGGVEDLRFANRRQLREQYFKLKHPLLNQVLPDRVIGFATHSANEPEQTREKSSEQLLTEIKALSGAITQSRDAQDPHLEELKKQTAHLEEIKQRTDSNPAMNNNNAGNR